MAVAHWPRRPPKREVRFAPPLEGAPLPPLLEGVAENVALASISACSRIGSVSIPPSLPIKCMAKAVSGVLPREDKATAMRALRLSGESLASQSGGPFLRRSGRFQGCDITVRAASWVRRR